ncbi:hypothetical protein GHK86_03965 [Acidimicrobiaceae bacterium USS-CC1]|uniref:Uncharacterized protein n=1 Tax=Acidiferrimicrobium australe TaxID=2664430 RepID=A0ABW9QQH0_9ACTN|nr:hypothetical protein [Acidiferrimicrobium australe]
MWQPGSPTRRLAGAAVATLAVAVGLAFGGDLWGRLLASGAFGGLVTVLPRVWRSFRHPDPPPG